MDYVPCPLFVRLVDVSARQICSTPRMICSPGKTKQAKPVRLLIIRAFLQALISTELLACSCKT